MVWGIERLSSSSKLSESYVEGNPILKSFTMKPEGPKPYDYRLFALKICVIQV